MKAMKTYFSGDFVGHTSNNISSGNS